MAKRSWCNSMETNTPHSLENIRSSSPTARITPCHHLKRSPKWKAAERRTDARREEAMKSDSPTTPEQSGPAVASSDGLEGVEAKALRDLADKIIHWRNDAHAASHGEYGPMPQGEPIDYWRGRRNVLHELHAFLPDGFRDDRAF